MMVIKGTRAIGRRVGKFTSMGNHKLKQRYLSTVAVVLLPIPSKLLLVLAQTVNNTRTTQTTQGILVNFQWDGEGVINVVKRIIGSVSFVQMETIPTPLLWRHFTVN